MKFGSLAIPSTAILALVLIGGAIAGIVASVVLASEPAPQPPPAATATPVPQPSPAPTPAPTPEPAPTQTPAALKLPAPPQKSEALISPDGPPGGGSSSGPKTADAGKVYTWKDGDRTLNVVLLKDLVVQKTSDITPDDLVVSKGASESIVQKQAKHSQDSLPVFKSESGGGLMTLPGGVVIALEPTWDEEKVESFLSENGITMDMTSNLGILKNAFVIETAPGFPSLELANELAALDGVMISSPNWQTDVETK